MSAAFAALNRLKDLFKKDRNAALVYLKDLCTYRRPGFVHALTTSEFLEEIALENSWEEGVKLLLGIFSSLLW